MPDDPQHQSTPPSRWAWIAAALAVAFAINRYNAASRPPEVLPPALAAEAGAALCAAYRDWSARAGDVSEGMDRICR